MPNNSYPIGNTDGSAAPAGTIGELIEVTQTAAIGSGFTIAQFGNVTTLTLTPGDWWVYALGDNAFNTSTTRVLWALSIFSGNTTTDHVTGVNVQDSSLGVTGTIHGGANILYSINVAANTAVFLKCSMTGAVGNVLTGKISARRMR